MKHPFATLAIVLAAAFSARSEERNFTLAVEGGKDEAKNVLVRALIPAKLVGNAKEISVELPDGKKVPCQLAKPGLMASPSDALELTVLLPALKAGEKVALKAKVNAENPPSSSFEWKIVNGLEELDCGGRPVLLYFHQPFDAKLSQKGKEIANPTIKPYHHLFSPDGKTIVTNSNQGQYPHHRGIFYGFNNITYEGKKADVWHCRNGEHTSHEKIIDADSGPLFGRHTLEIGWYGQDGKLFANEKRQLTAFSLPGGTMIEFGSILTTPLEKIRLDGDPQHAGFHFRADSAMEKNTKETFFIRPDGKGEPGKELNWDPKTKKGPVNLGWDAMSFVLDGKRYTALYLDHPDNPKEARHSERCYGRVGSYFVYDLTKEKPLKVHYRLWFQEGEPTVEQCTAMSKAFTNPLVATISQ
jgi:hypothetical protein